MGIPLPTSLLTLVALVILAGCRTPDPLPAADVSQPGWRVEHGQALWKPAARKREIAGDLLLATGPGRECLVQFAKTPFPLVTARQTKDAWQIEFGAGARRVGGLGEAPARWVWFDLARMRRGAAARGFGPLADAGNSAHCGLTNATTGERLEVWFTP